MLGEVCRLGITRCNHPIRAANSQRRAFDPDYKRAGDGGVSRVAAIVHVRGVEGVGKRETRERHVAVPR